MIRWSCKPDPIFTDFVSFSLDYLKDLTKDGFFEEDSDLIRTFGKEGLLVEMNKLIEAHASEKILNVTDFHFLILHEVLRAATEICNDDDFEIRKFGGVEITKFEFEDLVEYYFWDIDFLLSQEVVNNLSSDQKGSLALSPSVFSIANNLKPHPKELAFTEEEDIHPNSGELYKSGEAYPYFGEDDV